MRRVLARVLLAVAVVLIIVGAVRGFNFLLAALVAIVAAAALEPDE
jgi:hypothetical protein